jgi:cytoskeleton-associated protein 5
VPDPDETPEEAGEEDSGPIEKRLESKSWKTRSKAADDIFLQIKTEPSAFRSFSTFLPKLLSDAHPSVQEKSLDIFKTFLEKAPEMLLMQTEDFVKVIIEKVLTSTKQNLRTCSLTLLLDFYEIQPADVQSFTQGVTACLENKVPKVQTAGVSFSTSLISQFGVRVVQFKTFLPFIEKFAAGSNAGLRTESLGFLKELYRWVRELVLASLQNLKKPVQVELQKAFEEIKDTPSPARFLKCKGKEKVTSLDVFELAEPRDIFAKFNQDWVDKVLEMEKWADKKAALDLVCLEANYPKLADKNPGALVDLCKKLINDNNVNVMVQALKIVGLLSKGLRKSFEIHSRQFFSVFLGKLKEKKTLIVQEVFTGLDNLLFSLSLDSLLIELEEALEDKANAQKTNLLLWLQKVAESQPNEQLARPAKEIAQMVKKITDDSTASIRNESFKLLYLLRKRFAEQINAVIKDFPQPKMKKLQELANEDQTEEKKMEPEKVEKNFKVEVKEEEKVQKIVNEKKVEDKTKNDKKNVVKKKKNPDDEDFNALVTPEDAESVLAERLPNGTVEKLKETSWKDKQDGLQRLFDWVKSSKNLLPDMHENVFRLVKTCLKDFKENNMAVNKSALDLLTFIGEVTEINRKSCYVVLSPAAIEKLADGKLTEPYILCLLTFSESATPKFIVTHILKSTSDCSKPKLFAECCTILSRILVEFGLHRLVMKDLLDLCKAGLGQANPVIKKGSTSLLCTIYSFIGEALIPQLKDIKEATLKSIQEELNRTEKLTKTSFRQVRGEEEEVKYDPKKLLEASIPRVNISALVTDEILAKLTDGNWKVRKEGLDDIEGILEKNGKRVLITGLEDMFKSLKAKLEDSNKSIVRSTLTLVCKLVESMGQEIGFYSRSIVPGLLANLGDKQSLLRQDALVAIDRWAQETGPDSIINNAGPPLVQDNAELRTELLNWLLAHKDSFPKSDLKQLAPGILQCLQDRTANIRNAAENLFSEVQNLSGFETFSSFLQDMKPAVLNTLKPIFEKYRQEPEKSDKKPSEPVSIPSSGNKDKKPIKRAGTTKIVADHEVKTSRNKKEALDIRITNVGEKEKRLDFDSRYKWSVEEIRPDYLDKLKEQIRAACSPDLGNLLFHEDFKKQAEAAGHLTSIIESGDLNLLDYFDLVFKWSWIELIISSNTQIYKAVLELDLLIVSKLESLEYNVTDTEANLILPVLCDKSGQNNVVFRVLIRNIIHSFCKIFSPDKVFAIVLNGLNSKNARSKVECIEEVGSLIKDFGESVFQPKDVKVISKQVNSADNNVRAAAVNTMAEIFKFCGDKTWGLIGDLPEKAKGILEQRFKVKEKTEKPEENKKNLSVKKSIDKKPEPRKSIDPIIKGKVETPKFAEDSKAGLSSTLKLGESKKFHPKNQLSDGVTDKSLKVVKSTVKGKVDMGKVAEKIFSIEKDLGKLADSDRKQLSPRETLGRVASGERFTPKSRDPSNERPPRSARVPSPKLDPSEEKVSSSEVIVEELELPDTKRSDFSLLLAGLLNLDPNSQLATFESFENVLESPESSKLEIKFHAKTVCFAVVCMFSRVSLISKEVPEYPSLFFRLVFKLCACETWTKQLGPVDSFHLLEELLKVLSFDEGQQSEGETEGFTKIVNQSVLKLLEIVEINSMLSSILKLMQIYKFHSSGKMNSVLIKCVLKVARNISTSRTYLKVPQLFSAMFSYLSLEPTEEMGTKAMKTIVNELVKTFGEDILQEYHFFTQQVDDNGLFSEWIEICLKANATVAPSVSSSVTIKTMSSFSPDNYKELLDMLASSETYSMGVRELSNFMENHPEIDPYEVLSIYPGAFKEKIIADVREFRTKKPQNSSFNPSEMQNRIAMIKQRLGLAGEGNLDFTKGK